uniref:winged helix-turn-helix transcriptional regulator n=1 Tax=Clostridium sp. NkU-1 TaxID=1095009 RepID=UPI000AD2B562
MDRNVIICRSILENPAVTQRDLSKELSVSLGTVNNLIKECIEKKYINLGNGNDLYELLPAGQALLNNNEVDGASSSLQALAPVSSP